MVEAQVPKVQISSTVFLFTRKAWMNEIEDAVKGPGPKKLD